MNIHSLFLLLIIILQISVFIIFFSVKKSFKFIWIFSLYFLILVMFITLIIIKINQENYNHEFLLNISKTQPIVHHNTFKHQKVITIFHKKLSKNMYRGRIGIVIPTFGRPEFVKKSFETLAKADLKKIGRAHV